MARIKIRLLSLWQPWAELLVQPRKLTPSIPIKPFETRHWRPGSGEPIRCVIHATKKKGPEIRDAIDEFDDLLSMRIVERPLSFGCIVGLVTFVEYIPTDTMEIARKPREELEGLSLTARRTGNFEPDRYAWRAENPLVLDEPIEHMGRQGGLMDVPPEVRTGIFGQLGQRAFES